MLKISLLQILTNYNNKAKPLKSKYYTSAIIYKDPFIT